MGSGRIHVKKEKTRSDNSGLFGLLDAGLVHGRLEDSESRLQDHLSYQDSKSVQMAAREVEFRKAEALTLMHRYLICK